jgi:hypothetical protein
MIWAVPAPDLTSITLNLHPLAGIVEDVTDQGAAGKLKRKADDIEREAAEKRAELAANMRALMAMVARAELDGWELDVGEPIKYVEGVVAEMRSRLDALRCVARSHACTLPGCRGPPLCTTVNGRSRRHLIILQMISMTISLTFTLYGTE